ncbi:MAG: hypothetical protein [Caudoviricetes sp.]|nr:MAG: hypothetical protein [Caudoviricetes sp.]
MIDMKNKVLCQNGQWKAGGGVRGYSFVIDESTKLSSYDNKNTDIKFQSIDLPDYMLYLNPKTIAVICQLWEKESSSKTIRETSFSYTLTSYYFTVKDKSRFSQGDSFQPPHANIQLEKSLIENIIFQEHIIIFGESL